jgi:hypothetical protein
MKRSLQILIGFLIGSYWIACAPKKFDKDPSVNRCQNFAETCISSGSRDSFDYTVRSNGGLVDILFVDDNSGSMSFEQTHMAEKFSSFLAQLDARFIDYRIGIITTDVSSAATSVTTDDGVSSTLYNEPRAINQNGQLLDGNLIKFSNGADYLTSSTANKEQLFATNIKRPETLQCEAFLRQYPNSTPPAAGIHTNCPSGDERGIFAANLFFDKNPASFVRPNAHLAVVFLADEDERSALYRTTTSPLYTLETNDQPETLVNKVRAAYSGKSVSVHSIIVKPGDQWCLYDQSIQMGPSYINEGRGPVHGLTYNQMFGSEGQKYAQATTLTNGYLGDICANDYGAQLSGIGANIVERLTDVNLACSAPPDLSVTLVPANSSISWTVSGSNLHFSEALPPGTQVKLKYSCSTL